MKTHPRNPWRCFQTLTLLSAYIGCTLNSNSWCLLSMAEENYRSTTNCKINPVASTSNPKTLHRQSTSKNCCLIWLTSEESSNRKFYRSSGLFGCCPGQECEVEWNQWTQRYQCFVSHCGWHWRPEKIYDICMSLRTDKIKGLLSLRRQLRTASTSKPLKVNWENSLNLLYEISKVTSSSFFAKVSSPNSSRKLCDKFKWCSLGKFDTSSGWNLLMRFS